MVEAITLYAAASTLIALVGAGIGYLWIDESFTGVAAGILALKIIEILSANYILGMLVA